MIENWEDDVPRMVVNREMWGLLILHHLVWCLLIML